MDVFHHNSANFTCLKVKNLFSKLSLKITISNKPILYHVKHLQLNSGRVEDCLLKEVELSFNHNGKRPSRPVYRSEFMMLLSQSRKQSDQLYMLTISYHCCNQSNSILQDQSLILSRAAQIHSIINKNNCNTVVHNSTKKRVFGIQNGMKTRK